MIAIFIFYDKAFGLKQMLSFSKDLKHCDVVTYDGKDFIMTYSYHGGVRSKKIYSKNSDQLIKTLKKSMPNISAIVSVEIDIDENKMFSPIFINSCNEIARIHGEVKVGMSFNPAHLYYLLHKKDGERNFVIRNTWRKKNER